MRKGRDQEFAKEVIQYFTTTGNRSAKCTTKYFMSKGKPKASVYRIIRRYLERGTAEYRKQSGRPRTQLTQENLDGMREILKNDPSISARKLGKLLGIHSECVTRMRTMLMRGQTVLDPQCSEGQQDEGQIQEVMEEDKQVSCGEISAQSAPSGHSVPKIECLMDSDPPPPKEEMSKPLGIKIEFTTSNLNADMQENYDDDALFSSYLDDNFSAPSPTSADLEGEDNATFDKVAEVKSEIPFDRLSAKQKKTKRLLKNVEASSVDEDHCLLCYQSMKKNETPVYTSDIVDANWNAMFILQKMLGLPKSRLVEYLETIGNPPGEWLVFCRNCLTLVDEAVSIQKEISDLEEKLRGCQTKMFQEIKTSWRDQLREEKIRKKRKRKKRAKVATGNSKAGKVTKDIRQFIFSRESRDSEKSEEYSISRRPRTKSKSYRERSPSPDDAMYDEESFSPMDITSGSNVEETLNVKTSPERGPSPSKTDMDAMNVEGYTCSSCPDVGSMNLGTLINHGLFHFRRPLKCFQCGLHFSSISELKQNPFAKKPGSTHICSSDSLVQSIFDPGSIWECSFCPAEFHLDSDRDSHEETLHSLASSKRDFQHKCISCSKQFRSLAERLLHRVLEHPEVASLSCLFCDQNFALQTYDGVQVPEVPRINDHIRKEHEAFRNKRLPDECDFCGAFFWTATNLQLHTVEAHGLSKTFSYFCSICHTRRCLRDLVTTHMVRIHMLDHPSHQSSDSQGCQICGYKTVKEIMLFEHKLTKHGVEPEDGRLIFTCTKEGCDFRTLIDHYFTTHLMKKHGDEKKYICRYCGKGFRRIGYRDSHEEIHRNEKLRPYQCEQCGKSYAVRSSLYIHKRLVHQKRAFANSSQKRRRHSRRNLGISCVRITGGIGSTLEHPRSHYQTSNEDLSSSDLSMHDCNTLQLLEID